MSNLQPDGGATRARFRELDGLRGIAALAVVGSHFTGAYQTKHPADPPLPVDMSWGGYGVQLFFLISGFVILMSARGARRPSDFVISRVSRLYPVYWMALAESLVLVTLFGLPQASFTWVEKLLNVTMVQRLLLVPNVDEVYWTLAIEMQFYAVVFALLWLSRCHLTSRLLLTVSGVWITASLIVGVLCSPYSSGVDPQLVWTPAKMLLNVFIVEWGPFFVTGMLAFMARESAPEEKTRWWSAVCVAALSACLVRVVVRGWGEWYWVLAVIVVFLWVVSRPQTRPLRARPIQWLGKVSYSLYIGHAVLGTVMIHLLVPSMGRAGATCVALVVVLCNAALLHRVGERRGTRVAKNALLRFRSRWIEGTAS